MYCPKCDSENIRHGFSGGELYGDSWTDIYCADCGKSYHIIERKKQMSNQLEGDEKRFLNMEIYCEDCESRTTVVCPKCGSKDLVLSV